MLTYYARVFCINKLFRELKIIQRCIMPYNNGFRMSESEVDLICSELNALLMGRCSFESIIFYRIKLNF